VEARNSVPYMGTWGRWSQWCNRLHKGPMGPVVAGFVLAKGERTRRGRYPVVRVLECVGAHYEVQDVPRARVYRWCPATVSFECECGEKPTLTSSRNTCFRCGADHTDVIAEVLETRMEDDEGDLPWRFLRSYFSRPKPI
jgi:hypothetical protein